MLEWATRVEQMAHAQKYIIKRNKIQINKIDPVTQKILRSYCSIKDVQKDGYSVSSVARCVNGVKKLYMNFKWQRLIPKKIDVITLNNDKWADFKYSNNLQISNYINYSVSEFGTMKNLKTGKILKIHRGQVNLSNGKTSKTYYVHRLMMYAFNIPNPQNKESVDHIDSNHENNILTNLRWSTQKEQMNNIETKKKLSKIIEITFPDGHKETISGLINATKKIGISSTTISRYAKNNLEYKNYKFQIL